MLFRVLIMSGFVFAMAFLQACGQEKLAPEDPCNFTQNSTQQRVSWSNRTPVQFYIHSSVPRQYYSAIQDAADEWGRVMGREMIRIVGWTNHSNAPSNEGMNIVYWMNKWDSNRPDEQGRTTIAWEGDQLVDTDIMINGSFNFFTSSTAESGKLDLESLMVHEFGHALGLTHTDRHGSVMLKGLASGTTRRIPGDFDVNSLRCEY